MTVTVFSLVFLLMGRLRWWFVLCPATDGLALFFFVVGWELSEGQDPLCSLLCMGTENRCHPLTQ